MMDRRRASSPVLGRQWSGSSSNDTSSPAASPAHPHSRKPLLTGFSTVKKTHNVAAKAAAHRLAQVMASQAAADEDDEDVDNSGSQFGPPAVSLPHPTMTNTVRDNGRQSSFRSLNYRSNRSPSPAECG